MKFARPSGVKKKLHFTRTRGTWKFRALDPPRDLVLSILRRERDNKSSEKRSRGGGGWKEKQDTFILKNLTITRSGAESSGPRSRGTIATF